jgi:hypothetical protein
MPPYDVTIGKFRPSIRRRLSALTMLAALLPVSAAAQDSRAVFGGGELQRPQGYREWVFVGAPVTPNDMNGGAAAFPEFHAVYIDPDSWAAFQKTSQFRDGTILVTALVSVGGREAASGKGYFMGEFIGLEATVKSAGRFPNEPGNWAYFSFTNADHKTLKATAAAMSTASCNTCHQGAAAQDWVFTQYYPVLRAGKPSP